MKKKQNIKRPEGILQNVITYFCFKSRPLSSSKLTKLVYLADVYHYQLFGFRLTQVPFIRYLYGVWASDVARTLEELYEIGILHEKVVNTQRNFKAIVPKASIPKVLVNLSKNAFLILEAVIEDWGNASPAEVVEFTKTTLPYINTSFGEKIDFSRCNAVAEYAKEDGISQEKAATLDILSDKSLLKQVLKGDADARAGRLLTHKQVFNEQ